MICLVMQSSANPRKLALRAVVPDRLEEAEHPLLHEVVGVPAEQEVGRGLDADEAAIAPHQLVVGVGSAVLGEGHEELVVGPWAGVPRAFGNRTPLDDGVLFGAWGGNCHSNLL